MKRHTPEGVKFPDFVGLVPFVCLYWCRGPVLCPASLL